jgi:hypothetical protein
MRIGCADEDSPESRLAGTLAVAIGARAAWGTHVTLGREPTLGVHGLAKVALGGGGVGLLAGGLALVLFVVLEAHCRDW